MMKWVLGNKVIHLDVGAKGDRPPQTQMGVHRAVRRGDDARSPEGHKARRVQLGHLPLPSTSSNHSQPSAYSLPSTSSSITSNDVSPPAAYLDPFSIPSPSAPMFEGMDIFDALYPEGTIEANEFG
jgi:hypothetical protein